MSLGTWLITLMAIAVPFGNADGACARDWQSDENWDIWDLPWFIDHCKKACEDDDHEEEEEENNHSCNDSCSNPCESPCQNSCQNSCTNSNHNSNHSSCNSPCKTSCQPQDKCHGHQQQHHHYPRDGQYGHYGHRPHPRDTSPIKKGSWPSHLWDDHPDYKSTVDEHGRPHQPPLKKGSWPTHLWEEQHGHQHSSQKQHPPSCHSCEPKKSRCEKKSCHHQPRHDPYHRLPVKHGSWPTHLPKHYRPGQGSETHRAYHSEREYLENHYKSKHGHRQKHASPDGNYIPKGRGAPYPYRAEYNHPKHGTQIIDVSVDRGNTEKMFINPYQRSHDLVAAFKALRERNPREPAYAIIKGQSVDDIVDMEVMKNGSMLLLTIEKKGRRERRVVKVEDIDLIGQREAERTVPLIKLPLGW